MGVFTEAFFNQTEGSGKKLHTVSATVGANSVHDEIVQLGIPYYSEYRVATGTNYVSMATADSHVAQLMAGASLVVYVTRVRVYQHAVATTAAYATWELFRLTTAGTGGSTFTPSALDSTDAASGAAAMSLPTVKGSIGGIMEQAECYHIQTVGASQNGGTIPLIIDWDFRVPGRKPVRIPAGTANGVAIQNRNAVAGATATWVVDFFEATY
jgi:hypothetical protein